MPTITVLFQLSIMFSYLSKSFSFSTLTLSTKKSRRNGTMTLSAESYWKRLGEPKTIAAPMVAQSDLAFRRLVRNHGTDLAFTQMIHAHNFVSSKAFQDSYLDVYRHQEGILLTPSGLNSLEDLRWDEYSHEHPELHRMKRIFNVQDSSEVIERWTDYDESGPLIVQIAGHDPQTLSSAAREILNRTNSRNDNLYEGPVSGIDVNCGCPQGIARKGRYGAYLMEESIEDVCRIISKLRQDLPSNVGVSCKIRIPDGVGTAVGDAVLKNRIEMLISSGCELISVHGRTLKENKTTVRHCNWDAIAQVVDIARDFSGYDFPVIANGGIEFYTDVEACMEHTGAKAIMSSESLLENPSLFSGMENNDINMAPQYIFERQIQLCHEYLDFCVLYPPLPGSLGRIGGAFNCIRSHLFKILYRYLEEQPDLRADLGEVRKITTIQGARNFVLQLEKRYENVNWDSLRSSNIIQSSWYRRHRNALEAHKMHTRGKLAEPENLSLEEKKRAIQKRIAKLKVQRSMGIGT